MKARSLHPLRIQSTAFGLLPMEEKDYNEFPSNQVELKTIISYLQLENFIK